MFMLRRQQNKNGIFISIAKIMRGTVDETVVILAGRKGVGWLGVAEALESLVFKKSQYKERKGNILKPIEGGGSSFYGVEKLSYEDAVKRSSKPSQDNSIDWSRVVVCTRESLWSEWSLVQKAINKKFTTNITLRPFQPDKAMFRCKSEEEAKAICRKGVFFMEGPYAIHLQQWNKCDTQLNKKVSFTGGWVEILDLPLNWWNKEVLWRIGEVCGGLKLIKEHSLWRTYLRLEST